MRKEQFKSILLVFLIMMNFVLGSKILIEKKLWPDGYNFFSNAGNTQIGRLYTSIINYFSSPDQPETQVFLPDKIIINTGDQTTRTSLNSGEEEFFELCDEAEKIIRSAFNAKNDDISSITIEELYSALSSDSVYFEYSQKHQTSLYADFLEADGMAVASAAHSFSDVVITYSPRTCVYIADVEENTYLRINVSKSADTLEQMCDEYRKKHSNTQRPVINYSFDLKFDQPFGTQKTTLNPLIQIYSHAVPNRSCEAKNPIINEDLSVNESIVDEILKIFNINPNTMRRYTQAGGTVVFVENNGTLKISTDGYIEYEATGNGIEISSAANKYSAVVNTAAIANGVNKASGSNAAIRLSYAEKNNEIKFDYIVGGLKMNIENDKISSGVEAVVENGYLKSYKQLVRSYKVSAQSLEPSEFFTALDSAIAKYSEFMNEIKINDMYIGYTDDGSTGTKKADWIVDVNNVIALLD